VSGNFFAIDRAAWSRACSLGINEASAFLTLACGTRRDNRLSCWSVGAVVVHAGMGPPKAIAAIAALQKHGLIRLLRGGRNPCYDLTPTGPEPELIWLPNALVTGAAGEKSPVCFLRQSHSLDALRLLVELHHSSNLAEHGGVDWRKIRRKFTRSKIAERGQFIIWGFIEGREEAFDDAPFVAPFLSGGGGWNGFWETWSQLKRLRLFQFVGHLVEADNDAAEIVHPFPFSNGEPYEREITAAAHEAAMALLGEEAVQLKRAEAEGLMLVPVPAHFAKVEVVGVARLLYHTQTRLTAAWAAKQRSWEGCVNTYQNMTEIDLQYQRVEIGRTISRRDQG
jgi:hypothetical protein